MSSIPPPPRRSWVRIALALLLAPLALIAASVLALGVQLRARAAEVRALCDAYPVGTPLRAEAIVPSNHPRTLQKTVRLAAEGVTRVEVRGGVMTQVFLCAIELREGRVIARRFTRED